MAEKRNRFATYGRSGVLSLQAALIQIQAHYQTLGQSEFWPKPSGLNMASSFLQMSQSAQEMKLAFEVILQTSKTQLDVVWCSLSENRTWRRLTFAKFMGYSSGQIAKDAREDSEVMKTITVVTMVYLPATFAAVTQFSLTNRLV
jgi:hypothetical protein